METLKRRAIQAIVLLDCIVLGRLAAPMVAEPREAANWNAKAKIAGVPKSGPSNTVGLRAEQHRQTGLYADAETSKERKSQLQLRAERIRFVFGAPRHHGILSHCRISGLESRFVGRDYNDKNDRNRG